MNTPITSIPGIGQKRAERLAALGISTAADLLYHFPRAYQHRGNIQSLQSVAYSSVMPGETEHEPAAFMLTVATEPRTAQLKGRMTLTKFTAFDESGRVTVSFFNNRYVTDIFKVGLTFRMWGRLKVIGGQFQLTAPEYELAADDRTLNEFVPIYPLTEGLTQKMVSGSVRYTLDSVLRHGITEFLPEWVRTKYDLATVKYALDAIHFPLTWEMLETARRRLMFEELFIFALRIALAKQHRRSGRAHSMTADTDEFFALLPFAPTGAQRRVISETAADLASPDRCPMARIVAGDVGSGKTVCAAAAGFIAAKSGFQSALMVPTSILARQHYTDFCELFEKSGIRVGLLIGSMKASEKKKMHAMIESGEVDIVVGTHALLSEGVKFKRLGLVITDEQHRFGVAQRAKLTSQGADGGDVHVMVMSATPIPRTLAMTLYGDLEMSILDELPPGRQKVDTFVVNESYRERLNGFIRKNTAEGRQVYVVCPQVEDNAGYDADGEEESKDNEVKNVTAWVERLREAMPDVSIGLLHGKLKPAEKDAVMGEFAAGNISVLVSTTVIEVGVNVPNATLMVVENAERFGLSQLHQLRGRVGRGQHKSWCILVSSSDSEQALSRLGAMKATNDGFKIAEYDLKQRGPGDFFASDDSDTIRQSGGLRFRLASLSDTAILEDAFAAASECVERGEAAAVLEKARIVQRFDDGMKL